MSSSERRAVLIGLGASAFLLSGCLRPMLASDGAAAALRGKVELPPVDDRFGYFMDETLTKRLGRGEAPAYRLRVSHSISEAGVAIAQDNSVTRITLRLQARWTLVRLRDGAAVVSDTIRLQSGYNATGSLYATRQTRRDIERRLARDLGERIARAIQARAGEIAA